jgi:hypothetical protein
MGLKYLPWQALPPAQLFATHTPLSTLHEHLAYHANQSTSPPLDFQQHLLAWVKSHRQDCSDTFNQAVILLGHCSDIRTDVIQMLSALLKHPEFYIRGNAAVSLAKLQVDQPTLIRQIGQLIFDHAGNGDWTASSAALDALIVLKQQAVVALPELLDYIDRYPNQSDSSRDPCSNRALAQIFTQIAHPHPKIVAWLLNLIEQQAREYATPKSSTQAICALAGMPDALTTADRHMIQSFLTSAMLDMDIDDESIYSLISAVEILFGDQLQWVDQWVGFIDS